MLALKFDHDKGRELERDVRRMDKRLNQFDNRIAELLAQFSNGVVEAKPEVVDTEQEHCRRPTRQKSVSVDDEEASLASASDGRTKSEEVINIQSVASKVHEVDVKRKVGQMTLHKVMPQLCEKVLEVESRTQIH